MRDGLNRFFQLGVMFYPLLWYGFGIDIAQSKVKFDRVVGKFNFLTTMIYNNFEIVFLHL